MNEMAVMAMNWEMLPPTGAEPVNPNPLGMDLDALGQRFSEMISAPEGIQGIERSSKVSSIEMAPANSLGTMVVAKLDAVGMDFKNNMERAKATFENAPQDISLIDALKAQYEMAVVTLQIDVVGKGVQKSVQNVESFLKMQ
jgi:hypothetical protein